MNEIAPHRPEFLERQKTVKAPRRALARFLERFSLKRANAVIVTTPKDREFIADRYQLDEDKIKIVPNPIDTNKFEPANVAEEEKGLVITVGRLSHQKNLLAVVAAMGVAYSDDKTTSAAVSATSNRLMFPEM